MVFGDFAAQPPEIISGKIYSGPGAESLLTAASAWEALAGELHSTASSYQSVISGLISGWWEGPSSASMAAAVAPYVTWISTTATRAGEAAAQARAAASAYEAALAATVPPAVIAANRNQLASLQATNVFGHNNTAIAATEAEYAQIWAQDVAAMAGYAGSSAAATKLIPFTAAPTTTNGSGEAAQPAATAAASVSPVDPWLQQIESEITSYTAQYTQFWQQAIASLTGSTQSASTWETLFSSISGIGSQATWTNVVNSTISLGISQGKNFFIYQPWSHALPKSALGGGLASPGHAAPGSVVKPTSATLGTAPTLGKLSVPPSWAGATPAIRLAATALPGTSLAAGPPADWPVNLFSEGPLGSLTGGALGSPAARVISSTGVRARATTGERRKAPVKLDQVIAQLQQQPDAVQHWSVDPAGLDDLVAKLSTKPGIHAVHLRAEGEITPARRESKLG